MEENSFVSFEQSFELSDREEELATLITKLAVDMVEEQTSTGSIELIEDEVGMTRMANSVHDVVRKSVSVSELSKEQIGQIEAVLSSDLGPKLVELLSDTAIETTTVFRFAIERAQAKDVEEGGFGGQLPT